MKARKAQKRKSAMAVFEHITVPSPPTSGTNKSNHQFKHQQQHCSRLRSGFLFDHTGNSEMLSRCNSGL
ncbi:hypothetical protein ACN42_g11291 [Penicillium freii]|uniref:Uncharacterized protein n=1 Tax=Penicillium freii TaxID=48697 RepID=A0A117NKD8_PENFR|nr:hypothetical protein ACN42_g11291 [Penicillium freii]